jgi:biotin carboxylase
VEVEGVATTAPMLAELLGQDWFVRGEFHTTTLEAWLS